jgi:hypothetical protein
MADGMKMGESKSVGDLCPRCARALIRREQAFFFQGTYQPGAFCQTCKGMWSLKGETPSIRPTHAEGVP